MRIPHSDPLNPIVQNSAESCVLSCQSKVNNREKFHRAVFELQAPKAVIKGVFRRLYCCYNNLLGRENDYNVFTKD